MTAVKRVEQSLSKAMTSLIGANTPPKLAACIEYTLFPGGARVRPRLVFAVADACGSVSDSLAGRAASAVEMLHCASLIQDDLQCFDAADTRRGRASVHAAFGSGLAILASDALIVGSFDVMTSGDNDPARCVELVSCLARHSGSAGGITAGQAWEAEPAIDVSTYHAAKTGSLFEAAVELGAICAGANRREWRMTGRRLGAAYQVADDLSDVLGSTEQCGKPVGVDASLGRPNIVSDLGVDEAARRLRQMIDELIETLPDCVAPATLRETIRQEARRFLPKELDRSAA